MHDVTHGCAIGFSGPRISRINPNLSSAHDHPNVQKQLQSECDHGHMAGPYDVPRLENFQCSRLGVVPKKGGTWHVIMHLSATFGSSVNDYISKEDFGLKYSTVHNAIAIFQCLGPLAAMAKVDVKPAFRLCPVR